MNKSRILYISRAYPPIVGGIENQNYELGKWLGEIAEVKIIANTRGRKFLPFFAPYALIKALFAMPRHDALLIGDGTLAILSWIIKLFYKKPSICVVHGLDINYDSSSLGVWYEKILIKLYHTLWIGIFIKSFDKLIAVGNETVKVVIEKGITAEKVVFIPNGVDVQKHFETHERTELAKIIGIDLTNKKVLLTSGRLAKRKGVAWFVRNVMPKLADDIIYVIAGDGPDKGNIANAIADTKTNERVFTLGYVTDEVRDILFNTCDVFIQPNIKVQGDMEGFGISVIEAASCKLPVIASELEGLKDAIKNEQNGFLVESANAEAYAKKINELLSDEAARKLFGEKAREFVVKNYSWGIIAEKYLQEIQRSINFKG